VDGQVGDVGVGVDTGPSGPFLLRIEAESVTPTAPLAITMDATASGGAFIEVPDAAAAINPDPAAGGQAAYDLVVPTDGTYHVWFRVQSPPTAESADGTSNDSFWISMGGSGFTQLNNLAPGDAGWVWEQNRDTGAMVPVDPLTYDLTAGSVQLVVAHREDGAQLDRIVVTDDPSYVPTGAGD
jgi:hypothetical protein